MKEAKKTQITEALCEQVKLMRKGGANQTRIGELLKINPCTVSRIEAAGFDLKTYNENTKARREKEKAPELLQKVLDAKKAQEPAKKEKQKPAEPVKTAKITEAVNVEPAEPKKIDKPVVFSGMTVREVEGNFGRYRRSDVHDTTYIDFEYTDGADTISLTVEQWASFRTEMLKAAAILGVEL